MYRFLFIIFSVGLVIYQSVYADQHSHAAHVHGYATLNIAVDHDNLVFELESPAMNIVGFEYLPSSVSEKQAVSNAIAALKVSTTFLTIPKSASCKHKQSVVKSSMEEHAEDSKQSSAHSEFEVLWSYHCDNPDALDRINVDFFDAYPHMETLVVNIITSTLQKSIELHSKNTEIQLK